MKNKSETEAKCWWWAMLVNVEGNQLGATAHPPTLIQAIRHVMESIGSLYRPELNRSGPATASDSSTLFQASSVKESTAMQGGNAIPRNTS